MIHFYVGKPRNGKSLRVMMKIIEVLTKTQQHVVTNMVLRLDVLQEYLDSHGHNVHVLDRVTILDDDQTKNFWLYRGNEYVLPVSDGYYEPKRKDEERENVSYMPLFTDPKWRVGGNLLKGDGTPTDFKGTCYVIDEVQNLWPARGWQGTGHHISFYLSQHGKLGDTVFFITQNVKNVDRLLYSVAQDFTYCRNHRMEKHGKFRGDDKFSAKTYPGPVQDGKETTLNVEEFKLDLSIAACYDTSAGVGMPGGGTADAGFRAKGIPLKFVWVGLAAVLVACFVVFRYGIPKVTNRFLAPALDANHARKSGGVPMVKDEIAAGASTRTSGDQHTAATELSPPDRIPQIAAVWIELSNGIPVVHAILDDGSRLPSRLINRFNLDDFPAGWVEARGVRYYLKRSAVKPAEAGLSQETLASR